MDLTIQDIKTRAVLAPLGRPIRTAVGTIPAAPLVLIDLYTREGVTGRSYIFAYTPVALAPLVAFIDGFKDELKGKTVAPADRMRDFDLRFRLLGWQGLIGMALSGLDMAFWDAMGRAADQPLVKLLGGAPVALTAYDSYGAVDPRTDEAALNRSLDCGFKGIKIKLGHANIEEDVEIVSGVRRIIGNNIALMVDYNQSLDPMEARHRINRLAEFDLHWVEEPVRAEDLEGHARVRAGSRIAIQTGENWWFPRDMANAIAAGASDYAMIDMMKIGGVTGWLSAMALAQAASLPVSSHIFVEASAHLLAITPTRHWLEYLDSAGRILVNPPQIQRGTLTARGPGLGLEWDEAAVEKYRV